jgi:branched-chain amino acid transport system substrate-binding protein
MLKTPRSRTPRAWLFISLLLCLTLLLSMSGCGVLGNAKVIPCPGLTVGVLIGADGDPLAEEQRDGYELALEEANAEGGPAGCPLSLVYMPEEVSGSSNQVYQAVRSLVEEQEVVAILGGTSSTVSMLAATLINRFSVPMLIPNTSSMTALPENNYWTFRVSPDDEMYSQAVYDRVNEQLGEGATIALLFEDTSAGHDAAVTAAQMADEQGYVVMQYSALDSSTSAATILATWMQETAPEVLYLILNDPNQASEMLQALSQVEDPLPLTFLQGNGFISREFLEDSHELLQGQVGQVLAVTPWNAQETDGTQDDFETEFTRYTREKYGQSHLPSQHSAMAYDSLRILQMTIRSGSATWDITTLADITAAREALRTDLQSYRENTPAWGNIAFSTGGQNQAKVRLQSLNEIVAISYTPNQEEHQVSMP